MHNRSLYVFNRVVAYLLSAHFLSLLFLSCCRCVVLLSNIPPDGIRWELVPKAMLIGVKFDMLIACYVSSLPCLVLTLLAIGTMHLSSSHYILQRALRPVAWWYGLLFGILIFVGISDARYFQFFDNHLNFQVTEWFGFVGDTAGLLFGDAVNWLYLFIAVVLIGLYEWLLVRLTRRFRNSLALYEPQTLDRQAYLWSGVSCVLLYGLVFLGMRGSVQRYPLKVSFAYFCDHPFYNKLGVNPVFNIIKSAEGGKSSIPKALQTIDEQQALRYVQDQLHFMPQDTLRPLTRSVKAQGTLKGKNVVLIFMESMSAYNLERQYKGEWLTPYLRSLRDSSFYWSNAFSTGIHTNNGIVGVHYGFVPNFAQAIMEVNAKRYTGLPYHLQRAGYDNMVFITGNPQYDNMNSFWRDNHIPTIYSIYDYDDRYAVNNFGVQDDYMFSFGIRTLNARQSDRPFFASFLTVSNHGPYVVPDRFKDRGSTDAERIIAYADDAVGAFMREAQQTPWGKNTVFVLVADHGAALPCPYEMNLPYNSIPVYIVADGLPHQVYSAPASQTDIAPTILSLLGIDFENNSMGIDLMQEQRRYAYFVSNEHLGVSDGEWFYCYGIHNDQEHLYHIGSEEDMKEKEASRTADMRQFGMAMLRVNLTAMDKGWTAPDK